jgi:hypothetical protein
MMEQKDYDEIYFVILSPEHYKALGKHARVCTFLDSIYGLFEMDSTTIPDMPRYVMEISKAGYGLLIYRLKHLGPNTALLKQVIATAEAQDLVFRSW